jgi:hypothetical protein
MALQRINWTQIDTEHVPSGSTVDIGMIIDPVHSVNTDNLSIQHIDFFDYLNAVGYTGVTPINVFVADHGGLSMIQEVSGKTLSTTYNTTLDSALATPATVGGIVAGTTVSQLTGKTFVEFVDELLFPIVLPTYTIPTISMSGVAAQVCEVGSTFSTSITPSGIKNDAGIFTQLRIVRDASPIWTDVSLITGSIANVPDQFGYVNPNSPNMQFVSDEPPFIESHIIPLGTTQYYVDGSYLSGLPKRNNKGVTDSRPSAVRSTTAPQAAASILSSIVSLTGIYPYFYGTSLTLPTSASIAAAIAGGSSTKVLLSASGTLSIPYNIFGYYIWFAYNASFTTKTKWYVTALDNGDVDNSFITTVVTQAVNSPNSYWSGINYKMHWSVYPTIQNTIEFRNS